MQESILNNEVRNSEWNRIDLGHISVPQTFNKLIDNKEIQSWERVSEIKSNCSCIEINKYALKEEGLFLQFTILSKSDFVVFNEKKLYLWQNIHDGENVIKVLLKTIFLQYS
jgi:hypothetical protein